jgi:hypothetical protein
MWRLRWAGARAPHAALSRLPFDDEQKATSSELMTAVTVISDSLSPGGPNLNRATP